MSKPDNFKNLKDSFETGYENVSNKELVHQHKTTSNNYKRQDISLEMNRRLIDEMEELGKKSSKLTWVIIALTIVMIFIGLIQVVLLFVNS